MFDMTRQLLHARRRIWGGAIIVVLLLTSLLPGPAAFAALMQSYNSNQNPTTGDWGNWCEAGWYITASSNYTLTRIETNFRSITANRPITIQVFTDRPGSGGTLLASGTYTPTAGNTWQGADLNTPVNLNDGDDYFIGMRNINQQNGWNIASSGGGSQSLGTVYYARTGDSCSGGYGRSAGSGSQSRVLLRLYGDPRLVANADSYSVNEDNTLSVNSWNGVLDNDDPSNGVTAVINTNPAHAQSFTLNSNGSFTYTPVANYSGTDSFTYHSTNGSISSNIATVTITITAVQDNPVAVDDSVTVQQNSSNNSIAPLANDTDPDGDALTLVSWTNPAHGTLSNGGSNTLRYTPTAGYVGTDTFNYVVRDGSPPRTDTGTVTITVQRVNQPPVADNDAYSTNEDTALNVTAANGVLNGDTDPNSDALTAVLNVGPTHGTLTLNANGSFVYTPAANYSGPDSFTYHASDGTASSNIATVTLTINPVNDAPQADNDAYSTNEDTLLTVDAPGVLDGDSDVDGNPLSAVLNVGPTHAESFTLNANGSFSYTPAANYSGADSFTYHASDGTASSAVATVTITVNPVNDPPTADDDSYSVSEDTLLNVAAGTGVLVGDSDIEGDPLTAVLDVGPAHALSFALNPNGSFNYTPAANYSGPDSFTYHASDGSASSAVATVTITVNPVNDPPTADDDGYSTGEDTPLTIGAPGVLDGDSDVDGDPLSAVLNVGPAHAVSFALNADGSFSYTPADNWFGSDSFTYHASDGSASSAVVTVNITVGSVNDVPLASDNSYSTNEDMPLTVAPPGVLAGDSDADGDPLTAVLGTGPAHGGLTLFTDGSFVYTPDANYNGPDSFTYRASDGTAQSSPATVHLTVNPVNDPPAADNDSYSTNEDTPLTVGAPGVLDGDSDLDGDALTAVLEGVPAHGTVLLNSNGSFTYTPNANYNGADSFSYHARDGAANSNTATVSITVVAVDDPPVAGSDSYSVDEDGVLTIGAPGVLGNDSDPVEGSPLTAALVSGPAHGTLLLNGDGGFVYTPTANYNGPDSFSYAASDGGAQSAPATVSISVNDVNDAPVAADDAYSTSEDTPLVIGAPGVLGNDSDPVEGSPLSAVLDGGPANGTLTLSPDGSFSYTPNANYNGPDSFTYHASDGASNSNSATVTISVGAVNDAPLAVDDSYNGSEDAPLSVGAAEGVLANDSDPVENNPLTAVLEIGPSHGTLTLNADGSFDYLPDVDFYGIDSFTYHATDGTDNSGIATVQLNIGVEATAEGGNRVADDVLVTPMNVEGPINPLVNDSNPNGHPLMIEGFGQGQHGKVESRGGLLVYIPDPGWHGEDRFVYHVTDNFGWHAHGFVYVTVWAPVPPCRDIGGEPNSTVYATVANSTVPINADVYCRVVVENGVYIRNGGEIGIQSIIDLGILQAVEVFGVDAAGYATGTTNTPFGQPVTICLLGEGKMIYLNAVNMPRSPQWVETWASGKFTCGVIPNAGTVILVP